jgi:hypothetical protein
MAGNDTHKPNGGNARANDSDAKGAGKAKPQESVKPAAVAGAGAAAAGTSAGAGAGATAADTAPKAGARDNATVKPTALAPDDFERDAAGNVVMQADGVTPRRKRGRKKGQSTGAATAAPKSTPAKSDSARAAVATEMLAAQFQILNTGIAYLTKFEDFKLDDSEAMDMAKATANVMAQFDYVPDPKVAAVLGLVTTTSMIYGPRLYLYRRHIAAKTLERREAVIAAADERAANGTQFEPGLYPNGPLNTGQFSG